LALQNTTRLKLLRRPGLYYGLYSRVARQIGVTPSIVRKVALGLRKSKRIAKALEIEIRRIEKVAAKVA